MTDGYRNDRFEVRQHGVMNRMTRKEAAFIRRARVGVLATVDEQGQPLNLPFCFAFDGECLYSPIDEKPKAAAPRELKRIRNIRANPRVSVAIHRYDDEDWSRLGWVMLRGRAEILDDGDEHDRAQAALRERYPQYRAMRLEPLPVIALRIGQVNAWGALAVPVEEPATGAEFVPEPYRGAGG